MKRGLIVGSFALLLAALTPQVSATTATSMSSWEDVEEPGDIYYPATNRFVNDSYVNITDRGSGVFRMELRYRNDGEWWDSGGHDDRGRSEVKGLGPHQKHGETFDYLSTMRVNSTWKNTSRFAHVYQLFAVNGASSVAYCVQMNLSGTQGTGKLTYIPNGTGSSNTARSFTFTNGTYATYRIRVKTGTSGNVGLSINGDAQQGSNTSMQVSGADGFRPKWGLYRGFDPGMSLGDTYVEHSNVQANNVTGGTKLPQTITFPALPAKAVGDADFNPGATASSGLPVSYQSNNTAVATIVSGLIRIVGPGTASITASQAGDATYAAAPNVSQTLTVSGGTNVTYYKIKVVNNPVYVLNVSATPANGVNVNVFSDNGGDNQLWKLVDVGSGYVKIVPRSNQAFCLDCSTTPANGVNVQVWSYAGNTRQQWLRTDLGNGSYKITVRANATFGLDCSTTPANGINVQVWTYSGNNRQQWILEPVVKVE